MMHAKFGELLGRVAPLSNHDVSEILEEQNNTGKRFGEIALAWGLCQPKDVWRAWADQCAADQRTIDLPKIGVDAQVVNLLPREMAEQLGMIPLRSIDDEVVIATADASGTRNTEAQQAVQRQCRFVLADSQQIRDAIAVYYPKRG
jgi:hypothetical protein